MIFNQLKNYLKPTDIYTSQRLMLCLMKVAGFLPLQITEDRNGRRLQVSAMGYTLSILMCTFNVVCFIAIGTNGRATTLSYLFDRPRLSQIGTSVKMLSIIIMVPLLYGSSLRTAKKMTTSMQYISNIDKRLHLIGIDVDYWKEFYHSFFVIAFIVTHFVLVLVMSTWQNGVLEVKALILQQDPMKKDLIKDVTVALWLGLVTHHLSLVTMTIINCYYATVIREIRERFRGVNRMLKCMSESASEATADRDIESIGSTSWNIRHNSQIYNLVDELYSIHNDLCDTCVIVSEYFSLKIVSVIATGFMTMVMNGYYFVLSGSQADQKDKQVDLVYTSIESICVALAIILACNSASSITTENEKCSAHVHRVLSSINAPDTKNKLLEFSLQLINRKIEFSGFGLFVINRALLLGIAEAITTYFLILVEFNASDSNTPRSHSDVSKSMSFLGS
ncbi:putative gustatory receptor 28a [Bradysia coprophila]|uniref:putative gustatory receptor 28a n=1 Tax=Bradysia coprophila TaxID=38358 RepID=UPI00187D907B|nr:putative gustatory receptor 28a [Bradysia coprophila]